MKETTQSPRTNFEEKQNLVGFFDLLLRVAKRNPELWKEICENNSKNCEKTAKNND